MDRSIMYRLHLLSHGFLLSHKLTSSKDILENTVENIRSILHSAWRMLKMHEMLVVHWLFTEESFILFDRNVLILSVYDIRLYLAFSHIEEISE